MDKITFESVMEEIKKSLGEARLMSIEEAATYSNLKPAEKSEYMKKASETGAAMRAAKEKAANQSVTSDNNQGDTLPPKRDITSPAWERERQQRISTPSAPAAPAAQAPKPPTTPSQQGALNVRNQGKNAAVPSSQGAQGKGPETPAKPEATGKVPDIIGSTTDVRKEPAAKPPVSAPKPPSAPRAPAAPKASAPAPVDTASIYKKHGVGSPDEDTGAFHRAEAEIAAAKKGNTSSTPAAKPPVSAPRAPAAPSAPRAPAPAPSSNLSKVEPGSAAAAARDAAKPPAEKQQATEPTKNVTNTTTPSAGVDKGDNATQGTSPKGFGSSTTRDAVLRSTDKNTTTTPSMKLDPNEPPKTKTQKASDDESKVGSDLGESFEQFVKKFLKESR